MMATRFERKKERTHALIIETASRLFQEKGYAATSLEDISDAADIATRTIYLHFESKAAIALSYFDDWLQAFERLILARPADEPLERMLEAALDELDELGWGHEAAQPGERPIPHPYPDLIFDGPPDIAGHVFQAWSGTHERLTTFFAERFALEPDDPAPRSVSAALFAAWIAALHGVRASTNRAGAEPKTARGIGLEVFGHLARGLDRIGNADAVR